MIAQVPKKSHNQSNLTLPVVSKHDLSAAYQAVLAYLGSNLTSTKCDKLVKLLGSLGYAVRKGSSGNHHSYSHPDMKSFYGSNFDCGHGKNPTIKERYIKIAIRTLESHSSYFDPPQKKDDANGV